jgi:hypothetical protein
VDLRLLLRFEGHTSWSLPQTDQNIQKLVAYLNTNRVTYSREIGEYGSFQIEITRPDLLPFLSFLKEQLNASDGCLHFPYQTLCVNGEGKFELIEYFPDDMDIDKFTQNVWNRFVSFQK